MFTSKYSGHWLIGSSDLKLETKFDIFKEASAIYINAQVISTNIYMIDFL